MSYLQLIITNKVVINKIINYLTTKHGKDKNLNNISKIIITNDIRFFEGNNTTAKAVYFLGTGVNTIINNEINHTSTIDKKAIANLAYKCDDQLFG